MLGGANYGGDPGGSSKFDERRGDVRCFRLAGAGRQRIRGPPSVLCTVGRQGAFIEHHAFSLEGRKREILMVAEVGVHGIRRWCIQAPERDVRAVVAVFGGSPSTSRALLTALWRATIESVRFSLTASTRGVRRDGSASGGSRAANSRIGRFVLVGSSSAETGGGRGRFRRFPKYESSSVWAYEGWALPCVCPEAPTRGDADSNIPPCGSKKLCPGDRLVSTGRPWMRP